jgi:hypothetical protein
LVEFQSLACFPVPLDSYEAMIVFPDPVRKQPAAALPSYCAENLDEPIGGLEAGGLHDKFPAARRASRSWAARNNRGEALGEKIAS